MQQQSITERIINHYDKISPYYKKLWSNHIHHGYYTTGKESKQEATENLIKLLVKKSNLKPNSNVLDVGCGIGGTSIWLAKNLNCKVTGVTISPIQARMAKKASAKLRNKPKFFVADANNLPFMGKFDAVFAIETISHYTNRENFFKSIANMPNKNGVICIADWFKESNLDKNKLNDYIKPIENGMLVSLNTVEEYFSYLEDSNLKLAYHEDISSNVEKTWNIGIGIIKDKSLWKLAVKNGSDFLNFLKSFNAMKKGFYSGSLRYKVIIAKK